MKKAIFILYSALKHYYDIQFDKALYYDPKNRTLYPLNEKINNEDEIIIVDSNVVTGKTILKTFENLKLKKQNVLFAGSFKGEYAKKILDIYIPPPEIKGYIIALAGNSGTGKSFIARTLELYRGIKQYKIGYAAKELNPGLYGENIDEKNNPFVVSEKFLQIYNFDNSNKLIIVDGVKSLYQLIHISYALKKPYFLFYVDYNKSEIMCRYRNDPDDIYYQERKNFFKYQLKELKKHSIATINISNFNTLFPIATVLNNLGFKCVKREWGWDIWGTKHIWLDIYEKYAYNEKNNIELINTPDFHKSYIEKYNLNNIAKEIIMLTATSFRIIDDILDEHDTRNNNPSHWKKYGIFESVIDACALLQKARKLAKEIGYIKEYDEMFKKVISAVRYEIDVEEGRTEYKTLDDWIKSAEREAAFRKFIGILKGENPEKYYWQGLKAQAKDDLIGAEKFGRKNTDKKLKRPLFKREFISLTNFFIDS